MHTPVTPLHACQAKRQRCRLQEEGGSELEEVERELAGQKGQAGSLGSAKGKEKPGAPPRSILSPIFLQAFTLTFLAEWGDRSQVLHPILSAGLPAVFGPFPCSCTAGPCVCTVHPSPVCTCCATPWACSSCGPGCRSPP